MEIFDLPFILHWLATSWLGRALTVAFGASILGAVFLDWPVGPPIVLAIVCWIAGTLGAAQRDARKQAEETRASLR